ncbi:MAG TPA: DUF3604 domain-containing protein [Clostridiaceae bacterium]|nr:DUF3604 domain-containing protein [Clostridiaceae bacterium]
MSTKYRMSLLERSTIYSGATRAWISAPSIVSPGEKFNIRISLLRIDGNLDVDFEGILLVKNNNGIKNIPNKLTFTKEDRGSILLEDCMVDEENIFTFEVCPGTGTFPTGKCNPIMAKKNFPFKLYWGDIHVHSVHGKCGTPYLPKTPDFGYWYAKEVMGHDFCAITDHANALTEKSWKETKEAFKRWDEPGIFVPILAFETDYDGEDGGHFNIYFESDIGEYKDFRICSGGTLKSVFEHAKKYGGLAICHHSGRSICGRDFEKSFFGGLEVEPVMEIYSQWGSSEEYASSRPIIEGRHPKESHYYRYALANGYPLGVVGGSDSHTTTPGGQVVMAYPQWGGKNMFHTGGVTAVYATELTRKGIFDAIRNRRCYAASLDKILVWIEAEGKPMGSIVETDRAIIDITIACTYAPITEVVIVKNGIVAAKYGDFGSKEGFNADRTIFRLNWEDADFKDESCYYVRVTQFDGDMAWSSPIWIKSAK